MNAGFYISGLLHALFIAFLLFGGFFVRDRLPPVSVADVTVLTEEEFAALVPPAQAPELDTVAPEPVAPGDEAAAPELPDEDAAPERAEPPATPAPETPEPLPDTPELTPTPPAEVTDTAPVIRPPAPERESAALTPEAAPAPAPRVAPEAAAPPPPEAEIAPEVQEEVAPDTEAEAQAEEAEATAPEEAATEIVTEAEEERSLAPASSPRPAARPAQPVETAAAPAPEPAPEPEPEPRAEPAPAPVQPDDAAIEAALAEAAAAETPTGPSGPPLTGAERDAFRISVQDCWVVDVGSEAANVTVVVGVSLNPDGSVRQETLELLDGEGGSQQAVQTAFNAARRAILRCGASGFDLPVDKYDQWRDIEMTFNPEGMRLR